MYSLLAVFGALAGVTTVLFGFGGGFVAVPLLFTVLVATHGPASLIGQEAMHIAVATSTCVMVFGASMASWRHHRAGTLRWEHVRPLMASMAVGAVLGAWAAASLSGAWVRWAFIAYLGITIVDSVARPGFMQGGASALRPMARMATAGAGLVIGGIAAFLGVGGSVMTVPLMRRRGASMTEATAMANPLSLPMALAGTATYMLMAWCMPPLGDWHVGYVDLKAFLALAAGSWVGIRLASRWIGKMPDHVHARVYVGLLAVVLLVMVLA